MGLDEFLKSLQNSTAIAISLLAIATIYIIRELRDQKKSEEAAKRKHNKIE